MNIYSQYLLRYTPLVLQRARRGFRRLPVRRANVHHR
jgi:hypothetical protein